MLSLAAALAPAASFPEQVRADRIAHEREIIAEYLEFLALPNIAADVAGLRRNAEFIRGMLARRGIAARLLEGPRAGVAPAVYGEVSVPGATRTIVFYAHYDGMPVNPAQWAAGWEPFGPRFVTAPAERGGRLIADWKPGQPVNPEWRLTGRGSADDKAGVMTILNGFAAVRRLGAQLGANLKFFFEGEEEAGSPHLRQVLTAHRELLKSDLWIIVDGPVHMTGRKMVSFGVRGTVNVGLTVYGPNRPLHSGHYGNWAPNPAGVLASLLASMKDDHGRVLVEGFYDDVTPLTEAERRALAAIPAMDEELKRELGLAAPESPGRSILDAIHLPSLNINGIQSANVGPAAANVIPTTAQAALNLRLVVGNDAARQVDRLVAHIRSRGFTVLDRAPTDDERLRHPKLVRVDRRQGGYNAQRTPLELPLAQAVTAAVQSTVPYPVIQLPSMGGSLPLIVIEEVLGAKVITVPVVNHDNNQHAENENVKVQSLWDGIETCAALLTMK